MLKVTNIRVKNLPEQLQRDVMHALLGSLTHSPIASASGTHSLREIVISKRGKTHSVKRHRIPYDPKTAEQMIQRTELPAASHHWQHITPTQRAAWTDYAERYRAALGLSEVDSNPGGNLFNKIQPFNLRIQGAFTPDAPTQPPPQRAHDILQAPADSPTTFSFIINHAIADTSGMHVVFEITPATKNENCKPLEKEYRYIRGLNGASFLPLQASGAVYTISNARFEVKEGRRYGVRIRILSAENIPSGYTTNDLTRDSLVVNPSPPHAIIKNIGAPQWDGHSCPSAPTPQWDRHSCPSIASVTPTRIARRTTHPLESADRSVHPTEESIGSG
jgi:hypothetical protein